MAEACASATVTPPRRSRREAGIPIKHLDWPIVRPHGPSGRSCHAHRNTDTQVASHGSAGPRPGVRASVASESASRSRSLHGRLNSIGAPNEFHPLLPALGQFWQYLKINLVGSRVSGLYGRSARAVERPRTRLIHVMNRASQGRYSRLFYTPGATDPRRKTLGSDGKVPSSETCHSSR